MFNITNKKRGRPFRFDSDSDYINSKKAILFDNKNLKSEYMNLVNLAYHTGKISEKEKEVALFLENLHFQVKKELEIKDLPKSSSHTWTTAFKASNDHSHNASLKKWNLVHNYLKVNATLICDEFLNLICKHHSYEELLTLKMNTQVMNTLKTGLKTINKMIDLNYL